MLKNSLKWMVIACLLISYINRGLFIAMPGTESKPLCEHCQEGNEINTLIEFLMVMINHDNGNNIDEDGDSPEHYNSFKSVQLFAFQIISQSLQLHASIPVAIKKSFIPKQENIPSFLVYGQIDHPPQLHTDLV